MKMALGVIRAGLAATLVLGFGTIGCKPAPVVKPSGTTTTSSGSGSLSTSSGADSGTPVKLVQQQVAQPGVAFESIGEIITDRSVAQVFKPGCSEIHVISFSTVTYEGRNQAAYDFVLEDAEGTELFRQVLGPMRFEANGYTKVQLGGIKVDPEQELRFTVTSDIAARGNAITIWRTPAETATEDTYAVIDGEKMDYNLYFRVFGR